MLSRFQLAAAEAKAGDTDKAVADYDALASDTSVDDILHGHATLQAAALRLDKADYAEMEKRLKGLIDTDSAWSFSARELLGLSAYRTERHARGREAVQRAARRSGHAAEFAGTRRYDACAHCGNSAGAEHHGEITRVGREGWLERWASVLHGELAVACLAPGLAAALAASLCGCSGPCSLQYPQSLRQEGRNSARRAHRRHHRSECQATRSVEDRRSRCRFRRRGQRVVDRARRVRRPTISAISHWASRCRRCGRPTPAPGRRRADA